MIPRIKSVIPEKNYMLDVTFDDGKRVVYDVKEDTETIKSYNVLREVHGFFERVQLDESRTCVYWNEQIDLPSDTIYEYGIPKMGVTIHMARSTQGANNKMLFKESLEEAILGMWALKGPEIGPKYQKELKNYEKPPIYII